MVIALGAFLGMYFDQTISFDDFFLKSSFSGISKSLVSFFELNDAFHSWWFSLAILFLSFNLIVCSIERLPKIYFDARSPRPLLTDRRVLGLHLHKKLSAKNYEEAVLIVEKFLGPKAFFYEQENRKYFFKETYKIARFGVYIVHIALLIIMFSSIYATQMGIDGNLLIVENEKERYVKAKGVGGVNYTHDLGFYVGCKDFRLTTFSDNTPMEFESDLFIEDLNGNLLVSKTVTVNNPLSYDGYTFYQASYQPIMSEKIAKILVQESDGSKKVFSIKLGDETFLSDNTKITPTKIYEDFGGLGQALRVEMENSFNEKTFFHIFRRYPELDKIIRNDKFQIVFLDTDQKYATGLSVGKLPGISIIFTGFLVLLIGLYLCFFLLPTRFFARICNADGHYEIDLAAQGFRHPASVKMDFSKRISSLSEEKHE